MIYRFSVGGFFYLYDAVKIRSLDDCPLWRSFAIDNRIIRCDPELPYFFRTSLPCSEIVTRRCNEPSGMPSIDVLMQNLFARWMGQSERGVGDLLVGIRPPAIERSRPFDPHREAL
jgi:hypothetical protein